MRCLTLRQRSKLKNNSCLRRKSMLNQDWLIEEKNYNPKKELYSETIYALSNGYMASRGTLEENHFCPEIRSYFGTYVSGIFDTYSSHYQAIVNLADFFNTGVYINGELLKMSNGKISNYRRYLDMYNSCLIRTFTWTNRKGNKTEVEIRRFVSQADEHIAALEYIINLIGKRKLPKRKFPYFFTSRPQ